MTGTIAKMQAAADKLDAFELGYDQGQRWNIWKSGECDCSSLSGTIIRMGGYPIDIRTRPFYTGNFASKAKAAGFKVLKFTSLSQVRPGDFLLTPGHHVVFVRSADQYLSAEVDERGEERAGMPVTRRAMRCATDRRTTARMAGRTSFARLTRPSQPGRSGRCSFAA